jgi:putative ABC transport system substrate-binding protein
MRRIGFLVSTLAADDPEQQTRTTAFVQELTKLGWTDGRNIHIDYRWALGDPQRLSAYAAELTALAPDVTLAAGNTATATLQQATPSIPIVFANARRSRE